MAKTKDLFQLYFHEGTFPLLPVEEILEKLKQNDFHQPENQIPLARMKDLLKNKFTLDRKKALVASSIREIGKNWFP